LYLEKQKSISDRVPNDPLDDHADAAVDLVATPRRSTRVLKPVIKTTSTVAPIKTGTKHQTPRKGQGKPTGKNKNAGKNATPRGRTVSASPKKPAQKSLRRSDTSSARLWDKANGEGNDDDPEDIGKGNPTVRIPYFNYF
jgi:hypothetical protein